MDNRDEFEAWYKSEFNREPCPDYGYESDLAWKTWQAARNDAWLLRSQSGAIEEMNKLKCICTLGQSLTGDGCRYCQPQEYIDRLEEWLDEERKDLEQAEARVSQLESFLRIPFKPCDPAWLLRKQAEAVENCEQEFQGKLDVIMALSQHAESLRRKADEAENG